ncbi:MAG: putative transaldolase [candidate division TM6 bacterium GW2011_GWF2_37_49]|nr:MAG: putative transaldolase [candidate division TM6 bacterium GW2011_GWF2_37_49]
MKIFLDTANREQIKKWVATGLVDGVTTNPTLLSKEDPDSKKVLLDICKMVDGPVSIEVVEKAPDAVFAQAKEIAKLASNVVVKIPCAVEYFSVIKKLVEEDVKINVTLVFSELQALMVAKLGATFISPFIGRLDDIGVSGIGVVENLVTIKQNYEFDSEILAASIRSVAHLQSVALAGADIATVPTNVLEAACKHPLTEIGIKLFDADWNKLNKTSLL